MTKRTPLSQQKAAELRLAKRALLVACNHLARAKTRYGGIDGGLLGIRTSMALAAAWAQVDELCRLIDAAQSRRVVKARRAA